MNSPSHIGLSAFVLAALAAFTTCAQAADAPFQPSVLVFNQKAAGGDATISYAYMPKPGFVALYATDPQSGKVGEALGQAALPAADSRDIKIKLATTVKPGETIWAELREGKITDLGASHPVLVNGKPVDQSFVLR